MKCNYCHKNTAETKKVPVVVIEKDKYGKPIEVHRIETITICRNPDCSSNQDESDS